LQLKDDSRNSFWVAILTFGEGWHNNHHAHPQSAHHGMAWYEIDPNWYGILTLRALGLARDVNTFRTEIRQGARVREAILTVKDRAFPDIPRLSEAPEHRSEPIAGTRA